MRPDNHGLRGSGRSSADPLAGRSCVSGFRLVPALTAALFLLGLIGADADEPAAGATTQTSFSADSFALYSPRTALGISSISTGSFPKERLFHSPNRSGALAGTERVDQTPGSFAKLPPASEASHRQKIPDDE